MKLANEAVDKVRRGEHRERSKAGDNRLAKTKHIENAQDDKTDASALRLIYNHER